MRGSIQQRWAEVTSSLLPKTQSPLTGVGSSQSLCHAATAVARIPIVRVNGPKALLFDAETIRMWSVVASHTFCIENEVYMTKLLSEVLPAEHANSPGGTLIAPDPRVSVVQGVRAVCILRPVAANIVLLSRILQHPVFKEYYIYFTNDLPPEQLSRLARADRHQCVVRLQVLPLDVFVTGENCFSLELATLAPLRGVSAATTALDVETIGVAVLTRMSTAITSACALAARGPVTQLRYSASSPLAVHLADRLSGELGARKGKLWETALDGLPVRDAEGKEPAVPMTILLLDRRDDLVTPLLIPWTYQAMLHEFFEARLDRVELLVGSAADGGTSEKSTTAKKVTHIFTTRAGEDEFFERTWGEEFGSLGPAVKAYMDEMRQETQRVKEALKAGEAGEERMGGAAAADTYIGLQRRTANVQKHVDAVHAISQVVNARDLMTMSEVEQTLVSDRTPTIGDHEAALTPLLDRTSPVSATDKLRLLLLYALRFGDHSSLSRLKSLVISGLPNAQESALVDHVVATVLDWANSSGGERSERGERSELSGIILNRAKDLMSRRKNPTNLLTQHQSLVVSLLKALNDKNLCTTTYPIVNIGNTPSGGSAPAAGQAQTAPTPDVFIFIIGGFTMKENRDLLYKPQRAHQTVLLGGTSLINSKLLLAELTAAAAARKPPAPVPAVLPRVAPPTDCVMVEMTEQPPLPPSRAEQLARKQQFLAEDW